MNISFKQFLEDAEARAAHFSAMDDLTGADADAVVHDPKMASFFSLGDGKTRNFGPYKVLDMKYRDGKPFMALVQMMDVKGAKQRTFKTDGDKVKEVPNHLSKPTWVRVDAQQKGEKDFEDLLNQWGAQQADPMAGGMGMGMGMGGMPGM